MPSDNQKACASTPSEMLASPVDSVLARLRRPLTPEEQARVAIVQAERQIQHKAGLIAKLANSLGQRYHPRLASLDTFQAKHPEQAKVIKRLRDILPTIGEHVGRGDGMIWYGSVGTGKDHLMAAMLYAAADLGITCRWLNAQDWYGTLRDRMDTGAREEEFMIELAGPQVLAISDPIPPAGSASAWNLSQLCRLLDRRYRNLKSTWVTLNATSEQDADTKLTAQVFDRLRDSAEIFPCFWPSYRERRKP